MICKIESLYLAISFAILFLAVGCSTTKPTADLQENAFQCLVVDKIHKVGGRDAESIAKLSEKIEERLLAIQEHLRKIAELDELRDSWFKRIYGDISNPFREKLHEQGRYKTLDYIAYLEYLDNTIARLESLIKSMIDDIEYIIDSQ